MQTLGCRNGPVWRMKKRVFPPSLGAAGPRPLPRPSRPNTKPPNSVSGQREHGGIRSQIDQSIDLFVGIVPTKQHAWQMKGAYRQTAMHMPLSAWNRHSAKQQNKSHKLHAHCRPFSCHKTRLAGSWRLRPLSACSEKVFQKTMPSLYFGRQVPGACRPVVWGCQPAPSLVCIYF